MPHWINQVCNGCGACLPECPTASILVVNKKYLIDADTCMDHKSCVMVCPVNAIHPLNLAAAAPAGAKVEPAKTEKAKK